MAGSEMPSNSSTAGAAPAPSSTSAAPLSAPASEAIRVRMYRVGFGDCFLVTLPTASGPRHILVDCGVHARGNINTLADVVDNIAAETGRTLAVVVLTHAHQDHLAGFGAFDTRFRTFRVGEVWLPWTENPQDPAAVAVQRKTAALVGQLQQHFAALAASPMTPAQAAAQDAVANLTGNERGLQLLRSGFGSGALVRYLKGGIDLHEPGSIPGLMVQVLGPPSDQAFLAQMDPPASQRYLRLGPDSSEPVEANVVRPFADKWNVDPDEKALGRLKLDPDERQSLRDRLAAASPESLAFAIDQARNNSSIVALFAYRGKHLLFTGDAQYGNWRSWLQRPDAAAILGSVNFLKVGHHGSENATPRDALEQMDSPFAAMVSTQSVPWPSIPLAGLMERLGQRTQGRVMRSDSLSLAGRSGLPAGPVVDPLPSGFSRGDFWLDCQIPL